MPSLVDGMFCVFSIEQQRKSTQMYSQSRRLTVISSTKYSCLSIFSRTSHSHSTVRSTAADEQQSGNNTRGHKNTSSCAWYYGKNCVTQRPCQSSEPDFPFSDFYLVCLHRNHFIRKYLPNATVVFKLINEHRKKENQARSFTRVLSQLSTAAIASLQFPRQWNKSFLTQWLATSQNKCDNVISRGLCNFPVYVTEQVWLYHARSGTLISWVLLPRKTLNSPMKVSAAAKNDRGT